MHSLPSGRLKRSLRKQVILFGLSVLLPALVLFVFIVRMNRQDIELRKRRAMESKQQKAEEIGRYLAERLEKTERVLLQELALDPASIRTVYRTHPELVFVGRIVKEKLLMPWEGFEAKKLSSEGDRSGELILQAQQAEFAKNDLQLAMTFLNRALASAASSSQKCFVHLQQGRILSKLGDEEGAHRLYREILGQSGDLTDEYGIPFSLYAADCLSVLISEFELILDRLEGLMEEIRWLPSGALYFIRDITVLIQEKSEDIHSNHLERIENLRHATENAMEDLERLESLKGFVSSWMLGRRSLDQAGDLLTWESHGYIPWIVGIREFNEGQSQVLFAFHGPHVLSAVLEEADLADTFPGSCRITVSPTGEDFSPGGLFEGFRFKFDETEVSAWSRSSLPFPILYWSILILVVGFTAFGGYLLWRDIGRELAIAEMRSQFAASVSHELKTPLTSIRMFAEALTMGVKKRPEAQKEYLRTIISESERLSRLLNNVLDFSKIEQGTRTYRFESTSLEEVIHAAEEAMAFPMNQKGFNLQVEVEKGIPSILADRDALEQAVLNLLHNAMKYSGERREIHLI
ncbi:MAG: HAMP domain-containing histidine kinase, partial [Candidatus Aminicenantes bacterium]|nr:HAMP domain-containing histidine kinase [Candidatus Aminicenantes bacterium]